MSEAVNQEGFMRRCFELAQRGIGQVRPNPLVGCVIVRNGEILAEGYHGYFGGPHAEVVALNHLHQNGISNLDELTLFVNLEPCDHFGKTPPCTQAIIESGIRNLVVSNYDPNPLVAGRGIRKLQSLGLNVKTGLLNDEGAFLNRRFFTTHTENRPYVILKWAQSKDGFMAPADVFRKKEKKPFWISCEVSRELVQKWRAEEQAILVGRKTIEDDNPRLTSRHPHAKDPVRIIIDPSLSLDVNHQVFSNHGRVLILNHHQQAIQGNLEYIKFDYNQVKSMFDAIAKCGIQSIIVEGGKKTLDTFILSGMWDEARVFTSSTDLFDGLHSPTIPFYPQLTQQIGSDKLDVYYQTEYYKYGT
jgi:diaminohydroxyphosphoribosylaminopyrimidine deaminase/5-amino-6-(5-phosphoribosylamino)uracil reductase